MSEQYSKGHHSVARMHDAVDGLLSSAEMRELDAHVAGCDPCRNDYARISETIDAIRSLPQAASTPDGLWAGIATRIEGDAPGVEDPVADVLRFPGAAEGRRRFSFTVPQLAAAALVVSLLSGATVWAALGSGVPPTGFAIGADGGQGPASRVVMAASSRYEAVVSDLELILDQGRTLLSPETLLTIEQSLSTVNSAISDIETALQEDPNSDLLHRMLSTHQRTKLGVLQRAADAVRAQT